MELKSWELGQLSIESSARFLGAYISFYSKNGSDFQVSRAQFLRSCVRFSSSRSVGFLSSFTKRKALHVIMYKGSKIDRCQWNIDVHFYFLFDLHFFIHLLKGASSLKCSWIQVMAPCTIWGEAYTSARLEHSKLAIFVGSLMIFMELPSFRHPKLLMTRLWRAWPTFKLSRTIWAHVNTAMLKPRYQVRK
jgi:hypothetical protein